MDQEAGGAVTGIVYKLAMVIDARISTVVECLLLMLYLRADISLPLINSRLEELDLQLVWVL